MIDKLATWPFVFEMLFAFVVAGLLYYAAGAANRRFEGQTIRRPIDLFKWPVNNTFQILGLLIPSLIALFGFLYERNPDGSYTFLSSAICLFFLVVFFATWVSFSLIGKSDDQNVNVIVLNWPGDKLTFAAIPLTYGLLVLGLAYFASFLLFEFAPFNKPSTPGDGVAIVGTPLCIGQPKERVVELWGTPTWYASDERIAMYDQGDIHVVVMYNDDQRLTTIMHLLTEDYGGS